MTQPSLLLVDDDAPLRNHLGRAFSDRGWDVRTAANAEQAIEFAAEASPEHAVVDLRIGRDSGLAVVRDLLRIDPTTKVVVLTGFGSIATATRAIRLGALDYLTKPCDTDQLIHAFAQGEGNEPVAAEPMTLAEAEWEHINRVLSDCGGNITKAAQKLGLHRRSLQRKLARRP
ncbi:MAG: response regulator [Myxococcota bacterium]